MTKMIIDTDPGIDDAMAILFALEHPGIELLGLTTVFGNVPAELATANALRILEAAGADVPVCEGAKDAIAGPPRPYPDWVHGKNGMGGIEWPGPARKPDPRGAVDFIAETVLANPGEITLVPVGPLTNIALLVRDRPEAVGKVKEVVLMGGSAHRGGNVTEHAEANIANDPEGADMVFAAPWKVTMVGLDVTKDTVVDGDDFARIGASGKPYGPVMAETAAYYIDFYTKEVGVAGCCMHDVCAVALPERPDLFGLAEAPITVVTEGEERGRTVAHEGGGAPEGRQVQSYAATVDKDAMRRLFVDTLAGGG